MRQPSEHDANFVAFLERLVQREDRGSLAALRRGLGKPPGEAAAMHRFVVPWLPARSGPWDEAPYYLVASLFAWHQGSWRPPEGEEGPVTNLGASFGRLADAVGAERIEPRFVALLNCHREDLAEHLRHVIGLMKSKDVLVDWAQLLRDLRSWDRDGRPVQRAWARAFWRLVSGSDTKATQATASTDVDEDRSV